MNKTTTFSFIFFFLACFNATGQTKLSSGWYRAAMERTDSAKLIFNFEVVQKNKQTVLYIRNATERLLVDDIKQRGDSVFIEMPFFESSFRLKLNKDQSLTGKWRKATSGTFLELPVHFVWGIKERFPVSTVNKNNIAGKWMVTFTRSNGTNRPVIAEFQQKDHFITGTFLTPSGDYRFLEGVVSNDSLYLSCFDGSHAYLFTAQIIANEMVNGSFYSSASAVEKWIAVKNELATLPDTVQRTQLKPGESKLNFSFSDVKGNKVSINDARFKNKVVVIQLMGSWCPNCMDESRFLKEFYKEYKNKGVEIIALAYEYSTDFNRSKASVQKFINRFHIQYPVLIAPATVSDVQKTEKTLPQLTNINFFPTTIFIDKTGTVRKIHSGFYGPGTGEYYRQFKSEFYRTIQSLLAE
jgi:thiol-disulfide isomerase/thioredoxin